MLYYNCATGVQDPNGTTSFQNETWQTFSTPLSWATNGIWPTSADYSEINSVDRSAWSHPDNYQLLAAGDDHSKVKVYRYPCTEDFSKSVEGKGHSSHVTQVKFSQQNGYLFSAGGNDGCVFQWRCHSTV
jgi:microtubule-associated protein-like 6